MNKIHILLILLLLSSCSARDYHYAVLNETVIASKQKYHINQLKKLENLETKTNAKHKVCYTYPPALGGFSTGCRPKVDIR